MTLNLDINPFRSVKKLINLRIITPRKDVKTIFKYESKIIADLNTPDR